MARVKGNPKRTERWIRSGVLHEFLPIDRHGAPYWQGVFNPSKARSRILEGSLWEEAVLELVYDLGLTGTAVDGGANIGVHTLWYAAVCGLDVVAFEPLFHRQLEKNVAKNGLERKVRIHKVALGEEQGFAHHISLGRLDPGEGSLPVRSLDAYQLENVSLIKLDIEGMEPYAIRGGLRTIRLNHPWIIAEAWGDEEQSVLSDLLVPEGYTLVERIGVNTIWQFGSDNAEKENEDQQGSSASAATGGQMARQEEGAQQAQGPREG